MVKFYLHRIKSGKMTLDEVPKKWKEAVEQALKE